VPLLPLPEVVIRATREAPYTLDGRLITVVGRGYSGRLPRGDLAAGGGTVVPQPHFRAEHSEQRPKISIVWLTSENPFSRATSAAHTSTLAPCTSTVAPHCRHTRW